MIENEFKVWNDQFLEHLRPYCKNLRRDSKMFGSTWNCIRWFESWSSAQLEPVFGCSLNSAWGRLDKKISKLYAATISFFCFDSAFVNGWIFFYFSFVNPPWMNCRSFSEKNLWKERNQGSFNPCLIGLYFSNLDGGGGCFHPYL